MTHPVIVLLGHLLTTLRQTWGLALLSLALAMGLWFYVTEQQRPTRTGFLPQAVAVRAVNEPEGLVATLSQEEVRVRIAAPEEEWGRLQGEDFQAEVDLKGLGPGRYELPVAVRSPSRQVRVLEVFPDRVEVSLQPEAVRKVPVEVAFIALPPVGYEAGTPTTSPQQVTVRGPAEAVSRTEKAVAEVNLAGVTANLRQSFKLVPRSARGTLVTGVTLTPDQAQVTVPVQQKLFSRSLAITPLTRGSPAPGYRIVSVEADPPSVTVTAPMAVLEGLRAVPTEEVDVSGATSEVVREARLRLPAGATVPGSSTVLVRVQVAPAPGELTLSVAPRTRGLPQGLFIAAITPSVLVRLGGLQPDLLKLLPQDVVVSVSLEGLGPGVYSLEPQVQVPAGIQVLDLSPSQVEVTLRPVP